EHDEPPISPKVLRKKDYSSKKRIRVYYFLEILSILFVIGMNVIVVSVYHVYDYAMLLIFFSVISLCLFLLTTFIYIFSLKPEERLNVYIVRFLTIFAFTAFVIGASTIIGGWEYYQIFEMFLFVNIVLFYPLLSQFILQTYLMNSDKKTKELLFRKPIEGSPSELEWRKYNTRSGFISIVSGIFFLQIFWLIYHFIIRSKVICNTKRRLIIEHLDFDEETNLSTISLELGISLEEVIFTLKQLQLKRKIDVDFTRYGAILREIRTARLFTPTIDEKFEKFLKKQKMTEIERRASGFIEFTEREKVLDKDLRKLLGIKDKLSTSDFILMLPPKVATVRSPAFRKGTWIFFNREEILKKREKIIKVLVDNNDKIFN
ncbi:MAG: hypothetical protein KAS95_08450, partial [Candidatus Heimdallarchaeota archaeon]|nr:hypothetical protein [Candidatus Heimdallarchaeota archaeon]